MIDATIPSVTIAMVKRATSNALRVELRDGAGSVVGTAKQKFGVGVLFGFANGGKSTYTLTLGHRSLTVERHDHGQRVWS